MVIPQTSSQHITQKTEILSYWWREFIRSTLFESWNLVLVQKEVMTRLTLSLGLNLLRLRSIKTYPVKGPGSCPGGSRSCSVSSWIPLLKQQVINLNKKHHSEHTCRQKINIKHTGNKLDTHYTNPWPKLYTIKHACH